MLGQTLRGRYRIVRQLGSGGFSTTFVAEDLDLPGNPWCVVKQLKSKDPDPSVFQTARRLFDTEAQVLYRLGKHDRIPQLFAHFEENQEFYLVQEIVEGDALSQELTESKQMSESQAIAFLQDILQVLVFVHQQNVIHRDIKPSNLIRRKQDGKIVLIDFGAVKEIRSLVLKSESEATSTVLIGSTGYMPVEQLKGKPRFNSDIYAVGITAIQALTGVPPDRLEEDPKTGEIIWRERALVSNELAAIIDKMVRSHFTERYQSANEVLSELQQLQNYTRADTKIIVQSGTAKEYLKIYYYFLVLILTSIVGLVVVLNSGKFTAKGSKETQQKPLFIPMRNEAVQLFNKGNTLIELRHYEEAIDTLEQAIKIEPKYAQAWVKHGEALRELEKHEEALRSYEEALKNNSEYSLAWYQRGLVLEKLNRNEEALNSLNKAVELQPNYSEAWYNRGVILEKLQRNEEALTSLDKAVETQPDYWEAWYNRGIVLNKLERDKEALSALSKALQIQPHHMEIWVEHGSTLAKLKEYKEAIASLDKALAIKPDSAEAWGERGYVLGQLKRYDEAIASLDKAVQIKQDYAEAWYNRGIVLEKLKKYDDAIGSLDKAGQIKPDYSEAWYQRGIVLEKLKKYDDAIAAYDKAVQIWPANVAAIEDRKQLLTKLGR